MLTEIVSKQYKFEQKRYINSQQCAAFQQKLLEVMKLDPEFPSEGKAHIRSLYFEPEKTTRENRRYGKVEEQYSLKWIQSGESDSFYLIKKSVSCGSVKKQYQKLSMEDCKKMTATSPRWMSNSTCPLVRELSVKMNTEQLRPGTVLEFDRQAYVYDVGNVHATLDCGFACGKFQDNFLEVAEYEAIDRSVVLLKIRYEDFLPCTVQSLLNDRIPDQTKSLQQSRGKDRYPTVNVCFPSVPVHET